MLLLLTFDVKYDVMISSESFCYVILPKSWLKKCPPKTECYKTIAKDVEEPICGPEVGPFPDSTLQIYSVESTALSQCQLVHSIKTAFFTNNIGTIDTAFVSYFS